MAVAVLKKFGVAVTWENKEENTYICIAGGQQYVLSQGAEAAIAIEGDYGLGAVFLGANALGNHISRQTSPTVLILSLF